MVDLSPVGNRCPIILPICPYLSCSQMLLLIVLNPSLSVNLLESLGQVKCRLVHGGTWIMVALPFSRLAPPVIEGGFLKPLSVQELQSGWFEVTLRHNVTFVPIAPCNDGSGNSSEERAQTKRVSKHKL